MAMSGTVKILVQDDDVHLHPETETSDVVSVKIGEKTYDFSKEMVKKYPKLLDPSARYTLGFDAVLPLIYEYPATCIPPSLLDDQAERELFLSNLNFFEIPISPEVILHLSQPQIKEVRQASEYVRRHSAKKKCTFTQRRAVRDFCRDAEKAFCSLYNDIKPLDIVEMLDEGRVEDLVIHDFKGKNVVMTFVKSFLKKFLG